jgi:hypothetical protein
MRRQQRGITLLGWLFLLVPLAVVGYAGIRLAPVYLNYMRVAKTMDQVATEAKGDESVAGAAAIRNAIDKRLNIESITYPDIKDFSIRRDGQAWVIEIKYEDTAPLFSNVALVVNFAKTVQVQ